MLAMRVLWMRYGRSMLDLTCLNTKVCVTSHKEGGWEGAIGWWFFASNAKAKYNDETQNKTKAE